MSLRCFTTGNHGRKPYQTNAGHQVGAKSLRTERSAIAAARRRLCAINMRA